MAKYIYFPFAENGDRQTIPDDVQPDGSVSWSAGFTADYELIYPINPNAKPVPRSQTNQYLFDISEGVQQYQQYGFNDFITTADNLGVPFPYDINAICRYDAGSGFNLYRSLESANATTPADTTKWKLLTGGINVISATQSLGADALNQEFEVDVTAGDVELTLPPQALWAEGDTIKLKIIKADANQDNVMRVFGDSGELISNYNDHDFYWEGSWVVVKKYKTQLLISDYYDQISQVFFAFFDSGQSQTSGSQTFDVIFPSVGINPGSFYDSVTGYATMKIRGTYTFVCKLKGLQNISGNEGLVIVFVDPATTALYQNSENFSQSVNATPRVESVVTLDFTDNNSQLYVRANQAPSGPYGAGGDSSKPGWQAVLNKRII
jgi:hypothetical protein